jgi:hypothetical protein
MRKCDKCGGHLRRVHRTFLERFSYLAIYSCRDCHTEAFMPRQFRLHLDGIQPRCPKCATFRVTKLKVPDKIDPMHTGLYNLLERMAGGRLYHCRYCRMQFYDRRRLPSEAHEPAAEQTEAAAPGQAGPDSSS